MGDQTIVKLEYQRNKKHFDRSLILDSRLQATKTIKKAKFVRLGLSGDLDGYIDNMLSAAVPIKSYAA